MDAVSAALDKIARGHALVAEGLRELGGASVYASDVHASPVHASDVQSMQSASVLLDVPEAAALLGITEPALRTRINRGQVPGIVRTGRRIQFHRERLMSGLKSKPSR